MLEILKLDTKFGYQMIWYLIWQYYTLNDELLKLISYMILNYMSHNVAAMSYDTLFSTKMLDLKIKTKIWTQMMCDMMW